MPDEKPKFEAPGGGPLFPRRALYGEHFPDDTPETRVAHALWPGATIWDLYAAAAIQGMTNDSHIMGDMQREARERDEHPAAVLAEIAGQIADVMLAERKRRLYGGGE